MSSTVGLMSGQTTGIDLLFTSGFGSSTGFRAFDTVLGTADATLFNAGAVQSTTDDVITYTGQVFDASAANQDDGVFLEVVALVRNVRNDFKAIGQANLGHLTHGRVGLFGRTRHHLQAHAAAKRCTLESGCFAFVAQLATALADQLINRGHCGRNKLCHHQPAATGRQKVSIRNWIATGILEILRIQGP